jgi:hypothetical protein
MKAKTHSTLRDHAQQSGCRPFRSDDRPFRKIVLEQQRLLSVPPSNGFDLGGFGEELGVVVSLAISDEAAQVSGDPESA